MNFGYEGLGLFYTLLEKIALQEKPVKTAVLKKQLFVRKRLEKCWNFMEKTDMISSLNGETFNEKLLNFSEKYKIKKEKNRKKIAEWRKNQEVTETVTSYELVRNASKVKESKVKESKVNKNKVNKHDDFLKSSLHNYLKNIFLDYYFNLTENEFYWTVKEAKNLNQLINKITFSIKKKFPDIKIIEDNKVIEVFKILLQKLPNWHKNNLSISNINSKYNEIITNIKTQTNDNTSNKKRHITDEITAEDVERFERTGNCEID